MSRNHEQAPNEIPTLADKLLFWLFIAGSVLCIGLGVWALFFKM
jgi:hypothetical protein